MKTPKFVQKFMSDGTRITEKNKIWFIISLSVMALACVFALIYWLAGIGAMNLGIDFTGGTIMDVRFGTELTDDNHKDLQKMITDTLDDYKLSYSAPQRSGSADEATITVRYANEISGKSASDEAITEARNGVNDSLIEQMKQRFGWDDARATAALTFNAMSASASTTVWLNALFCVLITAALILIYIAIRFKLGAGLAAIIALLHDVFIMVAFIVILHWQINAPFIAAMITIIGYSINNTIVIFDRVRENSKKATLAALNPYELANLSVRQTMTRTINTSVTTLLTIVMLFIFGVSAIREFTLPIIIGLLAGTYSSIFIAPSLWAIFRTRKLNRQKKDGTYAGKIEKLEKKNA